MPLHSIPCQYCGTPFLCKPCLLSGPRQRKYCSHACYWNASRTPESFWSKVKKSDGCWEWQGAKRNNGYGWSWAHRSSTHRVSYEFAVGPIPPGLWVLHHCDNRLCVRPEHLFLGTRQDNIDDMVSKGREARGEQHGSRTKPDRMPRGERIGTAKLTDAAVRQIRALASQGVTPAEIGRKFGMNRKHIQRVVSRKLWKHLP